MYNLIKFNYSTYIIFVEGLINLEYKLTFNKLVPYNLLYLIYLHTT